jgi:hypothetical protein
MEATHLIINQLRTRAHGAGRLSGLNISPAAVRCLLRNWSVAERAGVRFRSDGVYVDGVEFRVRGELHFLA